MKFTLKGFFSIMLLLGATSWVSQSYSSSSSCSTDTCNTSDCGCVDVCNVDCCNSLLQNGGNVYGKTAYVPRPQGDNLARRMMGVQDKIHKFGSEGFYGVGSIAVEYQRAFRDRAGVGKYFSTNGGSSMSYGAIQSLATNTQFDINGLNFGVTGSGTISFCPTKDDIVVDLSLYLGLDELFCGLWLRLDVPIAHTRWNLGLNETVSEAGSSILPDEVYSTSTSLAAPFASKDKPMTAALAGGTDSAFGQVLALNKGKICGRRSNTNVSGIRVDLGYDWVRRENWHFATALDFVAPVGTTPSADYLFQPLVGDYKRAQIGLFTNFGYELWNNCDATSNIAFYMDFLATALLGKKMERLLGLNIPGATVAQETWSQYLLLKKFTKSGDTFTYADEIERAANITAGCIKVGTTAIVDLALLLQYNCNCFFGGLGYEFWYRSAEKIDQRCFDITANTYGVQGVQDVANNPTLIDTKARINYVSANDGDTGVGGVEAVSTTNTISNDSLEYCRALAPSMYSNKVFGFVGYNWTDCDWQPYILIGGEVEFGQDNRTFDQWGILAKGGVAF